MPNVSASNIFRGDSTTQNEVNVEQKDDEIKTEHCSNVQTEMKSEIVTNDTGVGGSNQAGVVIQNGKVSPKDSVSEDNDEEKQNATDSSDRVRPKQTWKTMIKLAISSSPEKNYDVQ